MGKKYIGFLGLATLFFAIDQFVKYYIRNTLYKKVFGTELIAIGDFKVKFHLAYNKGISFSLLSNENQLPILGLTGLIVLILLIWLKRTQNVVSSVGITMIIGGAIGNIFDRINLGGVVDFISISYGKYYFPTFNTADIFITFGVILILCEDIFAKKSKKL